MLPTLDTKPNTKNFTCPKAAPSNLCKMLNKPMSKPNGSVRLCVDYEIAPNQSEQKQKYQISKDRNYSF